MSKKKLQHFAENETFANFFQPSIITPQPEFRNKGCWNDIYFRNSNPIYLELGCGKGEYTVGLGRKYSNRNYIGVDIKGARMWRGAKTALEEQINNVAFVRTQIGFLWNFFGPKEISGIWITFPDPHPALSERNKRLTSPRFLGYYRPLLKDDAVIHLKTDDEGLYRYTLEIIEEEGHQLLFSTDDLYMNAPQEEACSIQTFYENRWLLEGKTIKYLRFTLKSLING